MAAAAVAAVVAEEAGSWESLVILVQQLVQQLQEEDLYLHKLQ